jgi:hypothetical protein
VHTVCLEKRVRQRGGGAQLQGGADHGQHVRDGVHDSRVVHVLQAVHLQLEKKNITTLFKHPRARCHSPTVQMRSISTLSSSTSLKKLCSTSLKRAKYIKSKLSAPLESG